MGVVSGLRAGCPAVRRPFQEKGVCEPNGVCSRPWSSAGVYLWEEIMRGIHRLLSAVLALVGTLTSTCAYGQGGATGVVGGAGLDTWRGSGAGGAGQIFDTRTESLIRKVSTSADGSFLVPLLPPGTYIVVVNKSGFAEAKAS